MQDLMKELNAVKGELHQSMKDFRSSGVKLAQAEHDYQLEKAKTWRILKAEGCTSTELANIIKGQPEVAEAMFKRDTAKATYTAHQEHINVLKLELRVIENQIAREWNSNG